MKVPEAYEGTCLYMELLRLLKACFDLFSLSFPSVTFTASMWEEKVLDFLSQHPHNVKCKSHIS